MVKGRRINIRNLGGDGGFLERLSDNIIQDVMNDTAKALHMRYGDSFDFSIGQKTITMRRNVDEGPLDLKPFFKASSKAKSTKDGGWYLVVPIKRKTRSMSHKLYQDIKSSEVGETRLSDYLYSGPKARKVNPFNPNERTNSITKTREGNSTGYVSFRTVSSNSPANSWILNREIDRNEVLDDVRDIVGDILDIKFSGM